MAYNQALPSMLRDLKNSHLIILPNVGHMPQEESPKKVIEAILKFKEER